MFDKKVKFTSAHDIPLLYARNPRPMNIFLHSLHHFLMKIRGPRFSPGTVKQQKLRKIKAQLTVGFQEVNLKAEKHDGLNTSLIGNEHVLEGPKM